MAEKPQIIDRADAMLRYFKTAKPGKYPITPDQLMIIHIFFDELHSYTGGTYSISEDGREIIKYS